MTRQVNDIDRHVGEQIRARRVQQGISQADLGKSIEVTFQQIQKYERGTNRVSAGKLYRLAHVLAVDLDYFFPDRPDRFRDHEDRMAILEPGAMEMAKAFVQVRPGPQRLALLDLARSMGAA